MLCSDNKSLDIFKVSEFFFVKFFSTKLIRSFIPLISWKIFLIVSFVEDNKFSFKLLFSGVNKKLFAFNGFAFVKNFLLILGFMLLLVVYDDKLRFLFSKFFSLISVFSSEGAWG